MIRLSVKQNKMCKEESSEQLVVGLIVPGLVANNSSDLAASVRKRCHEIVPNQRGNLSEDDDLYDELLTGGNEKKRRLTVDQVKFLEMSFNNDLKLEPERKALIAKQLGLRPRQVAIWFQNRRARWKNKRLEQDYESLKASYNAVVQENETMVKENEAIDEENKRLQEKVTQLIGMLRNREVLCHMDARGMVLVLDSESDSENALKGRDQVSGKLDVSATKSETENEMLDTSGLGHPASREAIVSFLEPTFVDSVIACAAFKYEGDYRLFSPSEDAFLNLPQSVSGYHVDDHLFTYEDYYSGFKWNGG